jgi:hypothetical protein
MNIFASILALFGVAAFGAHHIEGLPAVTCATRLENGDCVNWTIDHYEMTKEEKSELYRLCKKNCFEHRLPCDAHLDSLGNAHWYHCGEPRPRSQRDPWVQEDIHTALRDEL